MRAAETSEAQVLAEIVRRVLSVTDPDRIILFGSRARGEARPDSDYDVLVIGPSEDARWRRPVPIYRAMHGLPVPCDIVWWTPEEVAHWREAQAHFVTTAMREGRVLHERAA